jgi:hypothetical protein
MVDLLGRTASRPSPDEGELAPPPGWLTGAVAGLAMAAAGVVAAMGLAVVGWLVGTGGSMADALRVGADAWLLGHGSGLRIDAGRIEVIPLGLTLAVGWLCLLAGRWAARSSQATRPVEAATVAATYAAAYTGGVLGVALLASQPGAQPILVRALAVSAVLTVGAAAIGAASQLDDLDTLLGSVPEDARASWIGAVSGALSLLGCAALALVASLLIHLGALRELLAGLDPGLVGGLLLVLVSVAVLPNVVLFAVAVLLGPGLSIGTGTSVTLSEVSVGPMPAVPWFAAVPDPGTQPAALSALAAIPLVCGVVAGTMAVRRYPVYGYDRAALRGALAGVCSGLLVAALVAISGGAIGPGRMADVGPDVLGCLAVGVAALGIGGLLGGIATRVLTGRRDAT